MRKINHLYRRAGFGLSPGEWQAKKNFTPSQAVDELFRQTEKIPEIFTPPTPQVRMKDLSREDRAELIKKERKNVLNLVIEWIDRMADERHSALLERMTLFWHGHFACTTRGSALAANQLNTIRQHALGNFRELVLAVAKDPSMIRFLNNQQNKKGKPNENFARELMELFTIGRGNYTEQDIKEAARAFTGWSSNLAGEYVFRPFQHDYGKKVFFGKQGTFNGDDIVDILLEQRATSYYIAEKVYRYFVNEQPREEIVQHLADVFYNSGYDIAVLMRSVFESDWFYDEANIGTKIKSPVELVAGMKRHLGVTFENELSVAIVLRTLGQLPFNPPNVAGWPGGKSWIDNSTLMLRLNLPFYLMDNSEVNVRPKDDLKAMQRGKGLKNLAAVVNLYPIQAMLDGQSETAAFEELRDWLLPTLPQFAKSHFDAVSEKMNTASPVQNMVALLMSLPEYQVC